MSQRTLALLLGGFAVMGTGGGLAFQATPAPPVANATEAPKKAPTAKKPGGPPVLEGVVKDPGQKPLEGARVLAWPLSRRFEPALSTRTDAAGRFKLSLATPGPHGLRVAARGLAQLVLEKVPPGQSLTLVLAKGGAIEGLVRDATSGAPIPGVRVRALADSHGGRSAWWEDDDPFAATDARGRYRIEGLGPGLYSVTATARGFASAGQSSVRVGGKADLALRPGGYVFGTVRGPDGRPLAGAQARTEGRPGFGGARTAPRPTDAEGRFEVEGLEPGTYVLVVRHPDSAPAFLPGIRVEAEGGVEVTATMSAGAIVTGRLVGPRERPAAGQVSLEDLEGVPAPQSLAEMFRAEAGADGRFRLERVPPGDLVLGVRAPGYAERRVDASIGERQAEVDLGDVALEVGLAIRGRVHDKAGTGIPDAQVWAAQQREDGHFTDTHAGVTGEFVLAGLRPGTYHMTVSAVGFARVSDRLVEPGAENVEIALARGGAITGTVIDESRSPVEAFRVAAEPARSDGRSGGSPEAPKSSSDGRFTVEDLAEGLHVLKIQAPGFQPAIVSDVKVAAGQTTDIGTVRLARGGVVRGVVVDRAGQPVPFASVNSRGAGNENTWYGNEPQGMSDPTGAFEIVGLRPGRVALLARHPDYASASGSDLEVDPAKGPTETRIVLSRGGRIEGWVRKRDGSPAPGVKINLARSARGAFFGGGLPLADPGPDGSYAVEHVPEGSVDVVLLAGDQYRLSSTQSRTGEVHEGETTEVSFTVRDILVSGRVTRSGAPIAGARVRLRGERSMMMMFGGPSRIPVAPAGPQRLEGVAREDGAYELLADQPGKYGVEVADLAGKRSFPWRQVDVPDADAYGLDLEFNGLSVSGIVVDKDTGEPVPRAYLNLQAKAPVGPVVRAVGGSTEADGRFALETEPGDYSVQVRAEGYAPTQGDLNLSGDGVSGLRLELGRGLVLEGRVLDPAGRPGAGIEVSASAPDGQRVPEFVRTLPDGTFRFTSLASQGYNLFAGSDLAGFALRVGATPGEEGLVLRLRPAGRVHVILRDPLGRPMQGGFTQLRTVDGARLSAVGTMYASSDARGVSEFSVPAGLIELQATKERLTGSATVMVGEAEAVPAEITLTEAAGH